MTITAPTPILPSTTEHGHGRRGRLVDRALVALGLALVATGRARADAARIGREPLADFGPHRGAEVSRPFS